MKNLIISYAKKPIFVTLFAVAVLAMVLVSAQSSETDAAAPAFYIDETGATITVTTEPLTQLTAATTAMATGSWYYVDGNVTATTINATGDVHLIIMDGFTLTVTTINVAAGGTLSIYPGAPTSTVAKTGDLRSTAVAVTIAAGGKLINVSNIIGGTNGVSFSAGGTLDNYGKITGNGTTATSAGVYSTGAASTVNNYAGAEITGRNGVYLNNGGTIHNTGKITGNGPSTTSGTATTFYAAINVRSTAGAIVNNYVGGEIIGNPCNGIVFAGSAGGTVNNEGKISCTAGTYDAAVMTATGAASVTINNLSGAEIFSTPTPVSDVPKGVSLNAGGTIINNGEIRGTGAGVSISGVAATINNYNKISSAPSTLNASAAVFYNVAGTVVNNYAGAEINGGGSGVYLYAGGTGGTLNNYGEIIGGLIGACVQAGGQKVYNYGKITGNGALAAHGGIISTGGVSTIINYSTGEITGNNNGVHLNVGGTLENYGKITSKALGASPPYAGVYAAISATVINYTGAEITGALWGVYLNAGGTVENSGKITGNGATGANHAGIFSAGAVATINNYNGAEIKSARNAVNLSAGGNVNNKAGAEINGAFTGVTLSVSGMVENDGKITSTRATTGAEAAVSANFAAVIINNNTGAEMTGGYGGIYLSNGGTVNNYGNVTGTNQGIRLYAGGTVNNYSNIKGNGTGTIDGGIYTFSTLATINNNTGGRIEGGTNGIYFGGAGTITNNATVSGTTNGILHNSGIGYVDNYGTITGGTYGYAVSATNTSGATLINRNIINGSVDFRGQTYTVTFTAGSKINGGFNMSTANTASTLAFTDPAGVLDPDDLIYSTVTGAVTLGSSRVNVSFSGLPVAYSGKDVVLIDGGTVTGTQRNATYATGGHTFNIKIKGGSQLVASLSTMYLDVSLDSEPVGADLYYTITTALGVNLPETLYAGTFTVGDQEKLTIRADAMAGHTFIRWIDDDPQIISNIDEIIDVDIAPYFPALSVLFTAMYQQDIGGLSQVINVAIDTSPVPADVYFEIESAGGIIIGWTLYYGPFNVGIDEKLNLAADVLGGYTFLRWIDDDRTVVSEDADILDVDLTPYLGDLDVLFTAMYQIDAGGRSQVIVVSLESFPAGADIYYKKVTVGGIILGEFLYTHPFKVGIDEQLTIRTEGVTGYNFYRWLDNDGRIVSGSMTAVNVNLVPYLDDLDVTFTAYFGPPKFFYVTAYAEPGTTIVPAGVNLVPAGSSITFVFSAQAGYRIIDVVIDGTILLTKPQIELGSYTFSDVKANHTIVVKAESGARTDITLRIDLMEGEGHAEYSINGANFVRYTGVVYLPASADVKVRAVADDGYRFDRWETPTVEKNSEVTFRNVVANLYLELYFIDDSSGSRINTAVLILAAIILLMIVAALLLFFLIWRRLGLFLVVEMEGVGISDVAVSYKVDKNGKTSEGTKTTNSKGKCRIAAQLGSSVTITSAFKDGKPAVNVPVTIVMEKRKEYFDILFD